MSPSPFAFGRRNTKKEKKSSDTASPNCFDTRLWSMEAEQCGWTHAPFPPQPLKRSRKAPMYIKTANTLPAISSNMTHGRQRWPQQWLNPFDGKTLECLFTSGSLLAGPVCCVRAMVGVFEVITEAGRMPCPARGVWGDVRAYWQHTRAESRRNSAWSADTLGFSDLKIKLVQISFVFFEQEPSFVFD